MAEAVRAPGPMTGHSEGQVAIAEKVATGTEEATGTSSALPLLLRPRQGQGWAAQLFPRGLSRRGQDLSQPQLLSSSCSSSRRRKKSQRLQLVRSLPQLNPRLLHLPMML